MKTLITAIRILSSKSAHFSFSNNRLGSYFTGNSSMWMCLAVIKNEWFSNIYFEPVRSSRRACTSDKTQSTGAHAPSPTLATFKLLKCWYRVKISCITCNTGKCSNRAQVRILSNRCKTYPINAKFAVL